MKIAIFHLGFFYSGGGEKLVLEEIRGLRALGHEVSCFAPVVNREECFPDVPEMAEIRALLPPPPQWLPMRDALWLVLGCLTIPFMAWRFRKYDIFLGANQPGPWFVWVISKILNKPYAIYLAQPLRMLHPRKVDLENGIRIREGDHKFLKILSKIAGRLIGWADRVSVNEAEVMLTNGEYVSQWLRQVYRRDNQSCPAGCHPCPEEGLNYKNRWEGTISVNGAIVQKPYVLLTNRHSPQKRFEYALWALKRIARSAPELSLIVTGQETTYTDQLRYLAESLGLRDQVYFVGLVSESDLSRLYQEAVLYVYPSPEEDFGMGIVEAMAAGTPVIAWNNGGPTGTVKNGQTGFLIEAYDTEEFAKRMLELVNDKALVERMGRSAHRWATDVFSYEKHNRILETQLLLAVKLHRKNIRSHKTTLQDVLVRDEFLNPDGKSVFGVSNKQPEIGLSEEHRPSDDSLAKNKHSASFSKDFLSRGD